MESEFDSRYDYDDDAAAAVKEKEVSTLREMQADVAKEMTAAQDPITTDVSQANKAADECSVFVGNKINQKNTWELNLIDHLAELVKVEPEKDAETNFQKASCTLEAGVKIYWTRQ